MPIDILTPNTDDLITKEQLIQQLDALKDNITKPTNAQIKQIDDLRKKVNDLTANDVDKLNALKLKIDSFQKDLGDLKEDVSSERLKTNVLADIKMVKPQLDKIKSGKATDAEKKLALQ
jgi:flagellar hook-associated protein FlgK